MATCEVCEIHAESVFKIEGMDCHEEVAILERRLKKLTGLEALDADVLAQRLKIKYDAAKLSTSTIAEAVAQTGMRAWLEHEQPVGHAPNAATPRLGQSTPCRPLVALCTGLVFQLRTSTPGPSGRRPRPTSRSSGGTCRGASNRRTGMSRSNRGGGGCSTAG